jgi:hypothetical protein
MKIKRMIDVSMSIAQMMTMNITSHISNLQFSSNLNRNFERRNFEG